jgi:hypothetical protein
MFRQALLLNQATILVTACLLCLIVVYWFLDLHRQLMKVILGAFALRLLASVFIDRLGTFAGQSDYIKYDQIL